MWSISSISQIPQKSETVSAIKSLHIFNPEHDYALAVGNSSYTPPASVVKLKKRLSLLPALYAGSGDFILIDTEIACSSLSSLDYCDLVEAKQLNIVTPLHIPDLNDIGKICPWGWNHHILRQAQEWGIHRELLPTFEYIETVRKLSHRRNSINFRTCLKDYSSTHQLGSEIFSVDDVFAFLREYPHSYFKAPWSSSGRGVVSSLHIGENQLKEWAHGIIKRQGSLLAEPGWDKKMDFATEWTVIDHKAQFLGLSIFKTSQRGKYHGNIKASQNELLNILVSQSNFSYDLVEAQKDALDRIISPFYEGPLGIDMLVDKNGEINLCVEINLRLTMGHIFLENFYYP